MELRSVMDVMGLTDQPGAYADASMDTHEDLIARARRGDEEAFRLIFERYTRPVISFIFYMVSNRALAEELAQETFVRAYKSLNVLRDETKLSTWLFGIAKNVARESFRASSKSARNVELDNQTVLEIRDERESPAGRLLDRELSRMIALALLKLDEDKRLVFTLKIYQQRSYDEISEITGFSIPKIRNDLHRARIEMRRQLSAYLGDKR
ncbi:MAG TPA: sigma-70 family RNA polymerase sigma factor [Pyrinomonadaceae bacterium]|nr:sigma-70 family RNA polymerase sigma factor [Pyrinomonadaceae bacterium]